MLDWFSEYKVYLVRVWEKIAEHEVDAIFTSLHRANGEISEIEGSA
jgi:hypothetical protein